MAASNNPADVGALAALRPGMPVTAVEKAMGSSWRAPAPHKGGLVDVLENTYGVTVRLDRNGLIGRIDFNSRFKQTIGGVPMGIKLTDLRHTVPDMQIGEESKLRKNSRFGTMRLAEGELTARITYDTVYEIVISNPDAEYVEPTAPPYPAASGAPGAPFSDPNLKLAVMSALLRFKMLDLGTPEQLATHVLGRPVDLEQDGYELIPQALDYLVRYPLTAEQLAAVDWIQFDGGEEIYPYAWYFWSGEEGIFDIRNTSDIHLCVNLRGISVISMIDRFDLRTLVSLQKLEWISIHVPSENLGALLDMPSLKKAGHFKANNATREVLDKLEKRGVQVN
ncbi:hypothetical protein AGRO_1904 [Agrobacterium sp. ATCC 31749]|uniref:DUF7256 domain-containing protein n=1 Tax=unclassified Agrobacterium TaxID=2632611 RepID=UPI00020DB95A|nr:MULTISPECIES: hypothetical protein [unclassified Agrobacterium]EGL65520.1 hypothetical protein AGRO_1904 [Agrobacterium sp. ATCC 31749]QKX00148.1 hypothetical protein GSF67_24090 [Agrobacterium sp. CGMCC 11546]